MRTLGIDLETYSSVDLKKAGVYAYASAPDFELLLLAYAFNYEAVHVVDLASGESLPPDVVTALTDTRVIKTAFNANFERTCLSVHFNQPFSPVSWRCTAVQAAILGLPLHLEGVAKVLNLDEQKLSEGEALIRYFSMPCSPTNLNGWRTRNLPSHAPDKWDLFREYCKRDVELEQAIRQKLERYAIPEREQKLWILDQQINDRGISIDTGLVQKAIDCDQQYKVGILKEAKQLTGLDNPSSVAQLKVWLSDHGIETESLAKRTVADMAKTAEGDVKRLLQLRQEMAKTSIKKYDAMKRALCPDGRVRGLVQFYGANRTGRWAGRLVQVQNLPQNHLLDLDLARGLLKEGDYEGLDLLFDSVPGVLSELIRTAFIPEPGQRFLVADFSAIEARIIAWLAGEQWRLEVFRGHGKLYEASAAQMFKIPIEEITKTSSLRQKGKISELALGYGGSVGALIAMGALDQGVDEAELKPLVNAWRAANPKITRLWWAVDKAAFKAVKQETPQTVGNLNFVCTRGILAITLPSGRKLSYLRPKLGVNQYGREGITYEGIGEGKQWCRIPTYGPKLVENIVQATARDCLAEGMLRIDQAGYKIVMHVHDEVVVEAPTGFGSVADLCGIMGQPLAWAEGLPLRAEGFETKFYKKE